MSGGWPLLIPHDMPWRKAMTSLRKPLMLVLLLLVPILYVLALEADSIAGLFGILWTDEGAYMLSAKHMALFGTTHPLPGEAYQPEYATPLLHYVGVLAIDAGNTQWGIRFVMCLAVLGALALMVRLAARYQSNSADTRLTALAMMLCPMFYFYARVGLSEGLQLLVLAGALTALHQLYVTDRRHMALTMAACVGALTGLLLVAKLTSAAACVGLAVGLVSTAYLRPNPSHRIAVMASAAIAGLLSLLFLYFCWFYGHESIWWTNNIGTDVFYENVPHDWEYAWQRLNHHFVGLHHFLSLMPIFAIGFWGLSIAAGKRGQFLWIFWLVAMVTLGIESIFGGELRRSFYGLSMMMVLGAICLPEWRREGINWGLVPNARIPALLLMGCFVLGLLSFIYEASMVGDPIYRVAGPFFLATLLLGTFLSGAGLRRIRTLMLVAILMLSIAPMLLQVIFAPRTISKALTALEKAIPADESVATYMPWYFQGLRRQTIFTQCKEGHLFIGNPIESLPKENRFFMPMTHMVGTTSCNPLDFDAYAPKMEFSIFLPFNKGPGYGGSRTWVWKRTFTLYEKPAS